MGTANFVSIIQTYSSEKTQKQGQKHNYRTPHPEFDWHTEVHGSLWPQIEADFSSAISTIKIINTHSSIS
jgi:hypothetical protein